MLEQMIRIHDLSTGKIIDRQMNEFELAQYELDQMNFAQRVNLKL